MGLRRQNASGLQDTKYVSCQFLRRLADRAEMHFRVLRRFIGGVNAGEVLQRAGPGLGIEPFLDRVACILRAAYR
jgi:hypothetical protein